MMKRRFGNLTGVPAVIVFLASFSFTLNAEPPVDTSQSYVRSAFTRNIERKNTLGLHEELFIEIAHAGDLVGEAKRSEKGIILYFDGIALNGVYPRSCAVDPDKGVLTFFVRHDTAGIRLWDYFISSRRKGEFFERKVSISVGIEDQPAIPTLVKGKNAFTLSLIKREWLAICVSIIAVIVIIFLFLAAKSDILRDVGPVPRNGRKPYSLSLVQMSIWFLAIMTSWLLLYVVKLTFNTISETLVALMGISAGTGVGGVVIESNKERRARQSHGFLKDIISDQHGVSFHRFQIMAWTVVMVVVFVRQVVAYLAMPDFDSTLLILMGISSGTYLGMKATTKVDGNK